MLLNKLNLNNFKAFKNLGNFKLKPITILCGTNSCGKSSLLQSILLLKQTNESKYQNAPLLFDGKYIDLNSFIVLQNNSLIKIAKNLSETRESEDLQYEIKEFERKNEELIELIQKFLWNEEEGLYFDYDTKEKKQVKLNTIASFFPLIARIPTENQVERLIEHLKNTLV